ncbi:MAG: 6-hydroxymethylpterin diphosphokinase MptE-like protein [Sulfolobales archaeon]
MNLRDPMFWEGVYDRILTTLGFDRNRDYHSCRVLDLLLSTRTDIVAESRRHLVELLRGRSVVVIGDSADSGCPKPQGSVLVAADAAFEKCQEVGVIPDVVTTDLDGVSESSLKIRDTLFVVHAHGDNVEYLERLFPNMRGLLLGTAQYKCSHRVEVPGGFTDGDRAVFLAYYYGARKVFIYGFNFGSVSRWVKPSGIRVNATIKLAKLSWSRILLLLLKDLGYDIECLENSCEGWI